MDPLTVGLLGSVVIGAILTGSALGVGCAIGHCAFGEQDMYKRGLKPGEVTLGPTTSAIPSWMPLVTQTLVPVVPITEPVPSVAPSVITLVSKPPTFTPEPKVMHPDLLDVMHGFEGMFPEGSPVSPRDADDVAPNTDDVSRVTDGDMPPVLPPLYGLAFPIAPPPVLPTVAPTPLPSGIPLAPRDAIETSNQLPLFIQMNTTNLSGYDMDMFKGLTANVTDVRTGDATFSSDTFADAPGKVTKADPSEKMKPGVHKGELTFQIPGLDVQRVAKGTWITVDPKEASHAVQDAFVNLQHIFSGKVKVKLEKRDLIDAFDVFDKVAGNPEVEHVVDVAEEYAEPTLELAGGLLASHDSKKKAGSH